MSDGIARGPAVWARRVVRGPLDVDWDEGWWVLALGVLAAVVPVVLGVVVLLGTQSRDARLSDAGETGRRLSHGQVDDRLTADLIALQQDETTLFQRQVDYGRLTTGDPRADQQRVEADLSTEAGRLGGSARARADVTLITDELPGYVELASTALADNQQGLPVGAAYLRDASGYLRQQMLPRAADLRGIEQSRLRGDTAAAAAFPWWLPVGVVLALGWLVLTNRELARLTHRRFNLGLLVAFATVLALGAAALTVTFLSRHQVEVQVRPRAAAAIDLTRVQDDADRVELDDELTVSDRDEDCLTSVTGTEVFHVVCANEQDALAYLGGSHLMKRDLAAVEPQLGAGAQTIREEWLRAESGLPTLQNLAARAAGQHDARYDHAFVTNTLRPYTDPAAAPSTTRYFDPLHARVLVATEREWDRYAAGIRTARGGLDVLAWAALVLGVAAGGAAALGCRPRVADYWSRGEEIA